MQLFLVRHGQSEGNVNPALYQKIKDHNIKLTKLGKEQAFQAGQELGRLLGSSIETPITVIVSPYKRTRQTWQEMKKGLASVGTFILNEEETPLIREQEYKIFADQAEQKEKFQERDEFGHFYYRFKNTESVADVFQRSQIFLNSLMLRNLLGELKGPVVIVSHAIALHTMQMIIDKKPVEDCHEDIKNCEIRPRFLPSKIT